MLLKELCLSYNQMVIMLKFSSIAEKREKALNLESCELAKFKQKHEQIQQRLRETKRNKN